MVQNAETIDKVLPKFLEFAKGAVLVAHNCLMLSYSRKCKKA